MGYMAAGKIKVQSGDFIKGKYHRFAHDSLIMKTRGSLFREKIPISEIVDIDVMGVECDPGIIDSLGCLLILFLFFLGPIGLVIGIILLLGSNKGKKIKIFCKLRDGRKFSGLVSRRVLDEILLFKY
jgi:hypothetical protein